jgi:hypothetical protein
MDVDWLPRRPSPRKTPELHQTVASGEKVAGRPDEGQPFPLTENPRLMQAPRLSISQVPPVDLPE